jgi:hypothetical protein
MPEGHAKFGMGPARYWVRNMAKCEHEKERTRCRECNGGSFCSHGIIRGTCSLCEPQRVFLRYQRQAGERQLRFDLTLAQFQEITSRPCFYCNDYGYGRGIDRNNNFEGYTFRNSVACCQLCNRMKSDIAEHTFLGHVAKICRHQDKLKKARALEIDQARLAGAAPTP